MKHLTDRRATRYVYALMSITAITLRRPPTDAPVRSVPGFVAMW
jgi:hypothetical protein